MKKAGFIALVGLPNAGKSTLLNSIIGEKVSIVTPKPQTTRRRILGIHNDTELGQVVFVDTPGIVRGDRSEMDIFLLEELKDVMAESDALLVVLAADQVEQQQKVLELAKSSGQPYFVVLNKCDQVNPVEVDVQLANLKEKDIVALPISALESHQSKDWVKELFHLLPDSHPLYDEETYTTQTMRDMAAEIVREKCFLHLEQEIPYSMAVQVRSFVEDKKMIRIESDVLVSRDNHKKIVIGHGAQKIKRIGMEARKDLEKVLGQKVYLGLYVSARPDWMKSKTYMRELGYVADRK